MGSMGGGLAARARKRALDRNAHWRRARKFYASPAWQRMRRRILARDMDSCQPCFRRRRLEPATEVHHLVSLREDWDRRLDPDNLEAICEDCHRAATQAERRRQWERRRAAGPVASPLEEELGLEAPPPRVGPDGRPNPAWRAWRNRFEAALQRERDAEREARDQAALQRLSGQCKLFE